MPELFTIEEARALQGQYLIVARNLMAPDSVSGDEYCVLPENQTVHVVGLDAHYTEVGTPAARIVVQHYGHLIENNRILPSVHFIDRTTYEEHFILA